MRIVDSYAGYEGESNTWHNLVDRGMKGERVNAEWPLFLESGLLLFHADGLSAQQKCFRGTPEQAAIYYDEQRKSLPLGHFSRFHENKRVTGEEAFIDLATWDACVLESHRPVLPTREFQLYVGVDGSIKHDSAAAIAVRYDQDFKKVILIRHRIWQPTSRDPLDIDGTIGEFIRELDREYYVASVYYDPYQLHDLSTRLQSDGVNMVEFPQSLANLTSMSTNLYELIKAGNLILYPDAAMRLAASHAIAIQSSRGWKISKEKTSHKIDVIVALAMASLAAIERGGNEGWAWGAVA
jgi:phage terminase large subunit-like protein